MIPLSLTRTRRAAGSLVALAALAVAVSIAARADESTIDPPATEADRALNEAAAFDAGFLGERLRKYALALRTLGVPAEPAPSYAEMPGPDSVRGESVAGIARYLDPEGGLRRYLKLGNLRVDLFNDFFSVPGSLAEFSLPTVAQEDADSPELMSRLARIADRVRFGVARPLLGFRVLLDSGHMSTPYWDGQTGKYVRSGGKTVSEGQLNLWTAMLVGRRLEDLGAEVRLVRAGDGPVTRQTPENFDAREQTAHYYYRALDNWMPKYLALSDADLVRKLPRASEVTRLARGAGRMDLFLQEDLNARMDVADEFRPDLFLVFHFDASSTTKLQKSHDDVEVYVPGAMGKTETGGRQDRALMLRHLLETRRWNQTVDVAGHMARRVARGLNLPLLRSDRSPSLIKVEDGVYARNLFQTKRATSGMCVYFESLHYDHAAEFARLTKRDRTAEFRGKSFAYPSRLDPIAEGVQEGLLEYFREFR